MGFRLTYFRRLWRAVDSVALCGKPYPRKTYRIVRAGFDCKRFLGTGPNKQIAPSQVEQAIGPDVLETLSTQTGLSRQELLARLSRELPNAVDKYTPQGHLPTPA